MYSAEITYDCFDSLCEDVKELVPKWIPTESEIKEMESVGIPLFLALIAGALEPDGKLSESEKKRTAMLNKAVIRSMKFTEETPAGISEKVRVPYKAFDRVSDFVSKLAETHPSHLPTAEQVERIIRPNARYSLALILYLTVGKPEKNQTVVALRIAAAEAFEFSGEDAAVRLTRDEYEKMWKLATGLKLERDRWWPSEAEIETIVIPNFKKCWDFIIWLLETGNEPDNEADERAVETLRKILDERLRISDGEVSRWI